MAKQTVVQPGRRMISALMHTAALSSVYFYRYIVNAQPYKSFALKTGAANTVHNPLAVIVPHVSLQLRPKRVNSMNRNVILSTVLHSFPFDLRPDNLIVVVGSAVEQRPQLHRAAVRADRGDARQCMRRVSCCSRPTGVGFGQKAH